jgi:hypothetical protein
MVNPTWRSLPLAWLTFIALGICTLTIHNFADDLDHPDCNMPAGPQTMDFSEGDYQDDNFLLPEMTAAGCSGWVILTSEARAPETISPSVTPQLPPPKS